MSNTIVSVVMSVYNDAGRVRNSVESLLCQSLREIEVIAVDDGSNDDSGRILRELAARDARVRVIEQHNSGLTQALIRGCSAAQGELIARQDSDDWSHPERLERQVELLRRDARIGFVSCTTEYAGPRDERLEVISRPADPDAATRGLLFERQGPPAHGSVMFRRSLYEAVGGYRPQFYFSQDADLWLRMAEQSWIGYVMTPLYVARREVESTSGVFRPYQRRFGELGQLCRAARRTGQPEAPYLEEAVELKERFLAERSSSRTSFRRSGNDAAYLIGSQLSRNGDRRAAVYLWDVIRSRPWHWKAWVRLLQCGLPRMRRSESESVK
ncbi:MAG: glycosyltransferase family 2 protein [Planctomycetaceae bacterium]|nr:glycosyltransferase family 2 protein [Planctomycetaceae bacterium]